MKILFDQGVPVPLKRELAGHEILTAYELGWGAIKNGELIALAEASLFELLITTDQNLKYQQNLSGRKIAILVLKSTSWPKISKKVDLIAEAIILVTSNSYKEVEI